MECGVSLQKSEWKTGASLLAGVRWLKAPLQGGLCCGSPWSSAVGTSTSLSNTEMTVLPYVCACVLGPCSPV